MPVPERVVAPRPSQAGAGSVPARYEPLHRYLLQAYGDVVELTAAELDALVVGGLPARAREHGWFTNNPRNGYARAWVAAGWQQVTPGGAARQVMRLERAERRPLDLAQLVRNRSMRERWATRAGQRRPEDVHVEKGWHLAHVVYQVHLPDQQRFKVGLSRVGARRIAGVGAGRRLITVETIELPDRFQAELVEIAVLRLTDPWRILFPESHDAGGYTEMWSDDGPTVDLAAVAMQR